MHRLPLGVDMAKAEFVAAIAPDGELSDLGRFPNDARGFAALQAQLPADRPSVHLVVERVPPGRGGYELALVAFAHAQGWQLSLPHPKQVREWAKERGWRAKTDRQDARLRAAFAADTDPAPGPPWRPRCANSTVY